MRKIILLLLTTFIFSQPEVLWHQTYQIGQYDQAFKVIITQDDNYLIGAQSIITGDAENQTDIYLIKTDTMGNIIWDNKYNIYGDDWFSSMVETEDGNIIVGGTQYHMSNNSTGSSIYNITSNGELLSYDYYPSEASSEHSNNNTSSDLILDDNGVIIVGDFNQWTGYIFKIDNEGEFQWDRYINSDESTQFKSVANQDNYYYAVGRTGTSPTGGLITKFTTDNDIIWSNNYDYHRFFDITPTSDNNLIVCGETYINNAHNFILMKVDLNGNVLWDSIIDISDNQTALEVEELEDGGFLLTGTTQQQDFLIIRTDSLGNVIWSDQYEFYIGTEQSRSIEITDSNEILITGYAEIDNGYKVLLVKLEAEIYGCINLYASNYNSEANVDDGSCLAATLNVPEDFATIQEAIDYASDGDTVLVAAGTYYENINFNGKNISLIGEDRETTIIDGSQGDDSVVVFESVSNLASLNGFTLTGGSGHCIYPGGGCSTAGGGIILLSSAPILTDLIITNNTCAYGGSGIYMSGSFSNQSTILNNIKLHNNYGYDNGLAMRAEEDARFIISNSEITNHIEGIQNSFNVIFMRLGVTATFNHVIIKDNGISGNSDPGDNFYGSGPLFKTEPACNITFNNCLIINNHGHEDFTIYDSPGSSYTFNNCTLDNNRLAYPYPPWIIVSSSNIYLKNTIIPFDLVSIMNDAGAEISYSINMGNGTIQGNGDVSYLEGNLSGDPLFTNPENGDYTLQPTSPCIDAGDPTSPFDPDGTIADMGAYYFHQEPLDGDINGDWAIDIIDVVALIGHILGTSLLTGESLEQADVMPNGLIDIVDIIALVNIILDN